MKILIIKRAILTIICVAVIILINFFSSQSANDSEELSRNVTRKIISVMPSHNGAPQAVENAEVLKRDEEVRSAAHVGLFLVLGMVLSITLYEYNVPKAFLFAFLFCVLYAVFDEKYQEFLEKGRAFEWVDLLKDWSGSFIGITFVAITQFIQRKRKG